MNALVPAGVERDAPLVRLAAGGIAAIVRFDGIDQRHCMAWYVVQLGTVSGDVRGVIIGTFVDGTSVELGRLSVTGGTISESRFAVPQRGPRFAHVYVDLRADDLALRLEAPPLPPRRRSRALLSGAACIAAGVLVAAGGAFALALPRTPAVAAPLYAVAGDVLHVGYALGGAGSARYAATTQDGKTLAAGALSASHGELALPLPRALAGRRIRVNVALDGPLGRAARAVAVSIVAPATTLAAAAPPAPARITAFSARRERDGDGESVLASYLAVADNGTIVLNDAKGTIVGRSAFSRGGTSRIALAPGAARSPVTARLDVRRGETRAFTILTLPANTPAAGAKLAAVARPVERTSADRAPGADEAPASADDAGEAALPPSRDDDPFAVVGTPVAGRPFAVQIRRLLPNMVLRLEDDAGNAVDGPKTPESMQRVSFSAPRATAVRTYYLTCSYGRGNAQEVVVRSVRVATR